MSFQAFFDGLASAQLRTIAQHWNEARGARRMPAWSDIDPVAIGRQLRYVWSWKFDRATETFTGRLAGEDIVRTFGKSPRGMPMAAFFAPEVYEVFLPWHLRVVQEPAFLHSRGLIYSRVERNFTGERFMLPLAEDGVRGDGIIGATVYRPAKEDGSPMAKPTGVNPEEVAFFPLD